MLVLTLESSCDETSAAIVRDGRVILANAVASQIPIHRRYGGVVPELASRNHIRDIHTVIADALDTAGVTLDEIEGYGVTAGPGLVGSLLVGIETAKALAWSRQRPCVGLNHLEGHLCAVLLELDGVPTVEFPYLGVIVSGGHTDLYVVHGLGDYTLLGRTRDDAAGEAFDKVAKMLGLPYPGGVEIDRRAARGDATAFSFPRPMRSTQTLDFSFSGLKTAVLLKVQELGEPVEGALLDDICASFQAAVVDVLVKKSLAAASTHGTRQIVFSGGVACNSALRREATSAAVDAGKEAVFAPPRLCTDNAGMLGPIAEHYLQGMTSFDAFDLRASSNLRFGKDERSESATPDRHR